MRPCARATSSALTANQPRSATRSGDQPRGMVASPATVTTDVEINMMARVDSPPAPILRVDNVTKGTEERC